MRFTRFIVGAALTFALTAAANAAPTKAQVDQVAPGMTRADLYALLGSPQKRTFNGSMEAAQYCRNGVWLHDYTTILLNNGKVVALESEKAMPPFAFNCAIWFPDIAWRGAEAAGQSSEPREPSAGGSATGTAFKIGPVTLMTASHVVEGASKIAVRCLGMAAMPATVMQRSRATDIAVLSVPTASPKWLPISSTAEVALGEPVFVIGYPMSDLLGTNPRYNDGTVSALSGFDADASFLQISAPIQPGNSGGPVVSPSRGVVGVVSSTAAAAAFIKSSGGALPQNINFAARADLGLNLDRTLKTETAPVSVADALASTCFVEVQLAS